MDVPARSIAQDNEGVAMQTLEAGRVDRTEVGELADMTARLPEDSVLRGFLDEIVAAVESGEDISVFAQTQQLTPSVAAKLLGVSRVHVYRLMDRGELEFKRVGSDRRTTLAAVESFRAQQDGVRKDMALRAAHPHAARSAAAKDLAAAE